MIGNNENINELPGYAIDDAANACEYIRREFALIRSQTPGHLACDRITVVRPDLSGICTIEPDHVWPQPARITGNGYSFGEFESDCAPTLDDIINHMIFRTILQSKFDHVLAFVYFCDRQARGAAKSAKYAKSAAAYVAKCAGFAAAYAGLGFTGKSAAYVAKCAGFAAAYAGFTDKSAANIRLEQFKFLKKILEGECT